MNINQLLEITISQMASDLHLVVGFPPQVRINGDLTPVPGFDTITPEEIDSMIAPLLTPVQRDLFFNNFELDFSYQYGKQGRFRINLYRQRGYPAASFRLIPSIIRNLAELGLPESVTKLVSLKQGFILITGPTGHGKSTTLAAFINAINQIRAEHIITIEDPIEYVYPAGKSLISQREMFLDTKSWENALKSALREDPDIVLIGEMRDLETIASAMTIAETGHLVFATLHTNSASQSIDRIIDVFPENQQQQIRLQLSATLEAIISQRLIPTIAPGRALAYEIMFATPAARNMIRERKSFMIDNLIQTSAELGMVSLENCLANLVRAGKISAEEAMKYALRPELLDKLLK